MFFSFLQYVSPTWYFNLTPDSGESVYYIDIAKLADEEKQLLSLDTSYQTESGRLRDLTYQAIQKGFIKESFAITLQDYGPTIFDNYRFLRKYYHPVWSYYVLFIRLATLRNPVKEWTAFNRNRKVERVDIYAQVYPHEINYRSFNSPTRNAQPLVSVVIPTLNRYSYLDQVLKDLELQDYANFEVVVVDQSEPFQEKFYQKYTLNIKLIRQEEKALWLARNQAIKTASSEWILLTEDDVRLPYDWISNHIKCLDFFQADISTGVFFPEGTTIPQNRNFFRIAEQFSTGNACLKKVVFRKIGLFDRQFEKQRMGDGEFGLRAYLGGFKSISNPYAYCVDIKAPVGGLRQMGSWDAFRPKNWLAPRPVPSVLYLIRKYFGHQAAIYTLLIGVPPSLMSYRFKRRPILLLMGSLLIIPLLPLVLWQVWTSWNKATEMLKENSKIEFLS